VQAISAALRRLLFNSQRATVVFQVCFLRSPLTSDLELIAYKAGMLARLKIFLKDESGATAIEYGLIAAGIAVAIIAVVNGLGTKLKTTFSSISSQLK
jgi:pilus assembly protein Flp/PilA